MGGVIARPLSARGSKSLVSQALAKAKLLDSSRIESVNILVALEWLRTARRAKRRAMLK